MSKLNPKQKTIITIIGVVLVLALIVTMVVILIKNRPDKMIFVESDAVIVTVDGSESVQFKLNRDFAIKEMQGGSYTNGVTGMDFQSGMSKVIDNMKSLNLITGKSDEVILITVECLKGTDYTRAVSMIDEVMANKNIGGKVIKLYIRAKESKIIELAEEYDVSYGKAYFCQKTADRSNNLEVEDLITKTINEIYKLAKEDKSDSHVSSVVSDLNSSQIEIKPPKDDDSKPSSSSKPSSTTTTSSQTPSEPDDTSNPSSDWDPNSSFSSDIGSGWVSGWY